MIPAGVTRVIRAIAPTNELYEAMLGDFIEEYEGRRQRDGEASAQRWCWTEALRSLWHTMSHARPSPWVLLSSAFPAMLWGCLVAFLTSMAVFAATLPISQTIQGNYDDSVLIFGMWMLTIPVCFIGGYEAARVGRRAPLWSAALVAVPLIVWIFLPAAIRPAALMNPFTIVRMAIGAMALPSFVAGAVVQQAQFRRLGLL